MSFARLVAGLIWVKVVALALGVGGVGIFSLLQQVNLTGISLVTMSLAVPIINLGRPRVKNGTPEAAGRVAGTALALSHSMRWFSSSSQRSPAAICSGASARVRWNRCCCGALVLSILFGAMASSFWEGMSFLADRFDIYVRAGIASTGGRCAVRRGRSWLYGLRGSHRCDAGRGRGVVRFICLASQARRDRPASPQEPVLQHARAAAHPRLLRDDVRRRCAHQRRLDRGSGEGLLEAERRRTAICRRSCRWPPTRCIRHDRLLGDMHARGAAEGDTPQVRAELHQALRLGLLISFTGCGAAVVLADYLIPLFFAPRFAPAAPLMVAYMPGELFRHQLLYLLTAYQLTISRRRRDRVEFRLHRPAGCLSAGHLSRIMVPLATWPRMLARPSSCWR